MNKEIRFTPGPRKVIGGINVMGPNDEFVGTFGCNGRDRDIDAANANLDAAGPDMFNALRIALSGYKDGVSDERYTRDEIAGIMRSALFRALGE